MKHYVNPSGHLVELAAPPWATTKDPVTKQRRLKDGWREATADEIERVRELEAERAETEADRAPPTSAGGPLPGS